MSTDRDFDRIAGAWLAEGPTELTDRVLDAALDEVHLTHQRHRLTVPWRIDPMSNPFRMAVAAVIAVVAVGLIALNLPGRGGVGATPSPSLTVTPSTAPNLGFGYSTLPGKIMLEQFGNAMDGSTTGLDSGTRRLYLINPDGSGLIELKPGTPGGKASPEWSFDGTRVLYTALGSDPAPDRVMELAIAGVAPTQIVPSCPSGNCADGWSTDSADGTRVAFTRNDLAATVTTLGILDRATGTVRLLETTATTPGGTYDLAQPTWSPDGLEIAFDRWEFDTGGKHIAIRTFVVTVSSGAVRDITPAGLEFAGDPRWSPDGTSILVGSGALYCCADRGAHDVYAIRPDGTGLQRLTTDGGSGGATWAQDGAHILFYRRDVLFLMNADGSDQAPIGSNWPDLSSESRGFAYDGFWQPLP